MKTKFNGFLTLLLALVVQITFAQEKTVSGTVSEELGPLPGASILIQGTSTGTQTDFNGKYSIRAKEGDVIIFSYLGYSPVKKTVGSSSTVNVTLKQGENVLNEIVVTALGIKRKPKELSYSVQTVQSDDLTKTKAVNVATAMVGKVSGLQINTINNGVNPSTRVVLRGNRSLLGNNQALIVIDGYPSSRNAIDRISPDDIQNITVLKGANASALYGSDAGNGVLVITTKKGKGKLSVTYTSTLQMESVAYLPEFQQEFGAGGFPDGTLYPLENVNWGPRFDGRLVDASETYDDGRVWQVPFSPIKDRNKNFFDTGVTTRHGVSLSAGDETGDFLMSLDQTNVSGIVPKDKFNRTNFRLKSSKQMGNLKVGGNFSFYRSHSNTVGSGGRQGRPVYWNVLNTPLHIPLSEMKNWRDGEFTRNEVSYFRFYENPYFIIDTQRNYADYTEFTLIADAEYKFTDNLKATLRAGYTSGTNETTREFGGFNYAFKLGDAYANMDPYGPSNADGLSTSTRINTDFIVNYQKDVSTDFNINATVGHNMRMTSGKEINVSGTNLFIPDFYNVSTRSGELVGDESYSQLRKMAVYADVTLGFKDFLFLNLTGRNDFTSTLPTDNNSYFYPGAGVSFVASEAFPAITSDNGLSFLKASFNITKTGNDPAAYAANNIFFVPDNYPYGNTVGLSQSSTVADPELNPEFTTSLEAGLDFRLFKNRVNANITGYKTNSTDQLAPVNISTASGATRLYTNIGEIQNLGIEVDLSGTLIRSEDFTWDLGLNYSGYKSEVISLKDGVDKVDLGGFADAQIIARVGSPYPMISTTDYERDSQGRVVVGANGDPIQAAGNVDQGQTSPTATMGFNTTLKYKNFTFYAVMDYRTGAVFFNGIVDALEFTGLTQHSATSGRQPFVFPNSVYSDGGTGFVENTNRLTSNGGNAFWSAYNNVKSNYVTDASIIKIREVLLSYSFNKDVIDAIGVSDLSIGAYGRNLFTFRPDSNVYTDPEFNFTEGNAIGIGTQAQTPPTRQFGLTLNVKF
ncbi:SusC/RagA family TonB-linked outer membrane protein [Polaribacter sp. ALD11]|uniref:SusC/RagA family TonB-linked outer membrane protein n=1 Tax=Polaribacter sp. ALD11 TaxID=2058137 RepID=UPI000C31B580|nr:SusC/RagA family TonB-linked outer membrane protein [Polaribacter sp. ALD11]AUC86754.1 SusC/RagA family TonB-linked outer membrane protein [Polaribacter sp. ALD11]